MGNCIDHQSDVSWADEGFWDFSEGDSPRLRFSEKLNEARTREEQENTKREENGREGRCSTTTEVKIKITKKQLQELLTQIDEKGLPIQKVLAELISMSESYRLRDDQHWRPVLQSIPEVAE
ncbi:uncharacterized protein LOC109715048 [Ananas comosus]|uniref:Uncharacterized protein LOC109715048 n=1 Tax=Ananas comosus TaxID=4615 RepID=A0A199UQY3_ANACO|nr:uncharacterized protein LOC109715048 [Ananas comosus]OAY67222.1 hypothetical protein ACMD2_10106 [Ananas comosus]